MLKPLNKILLVNLVDFQKSKVDIATTAEDSERNLVVGEITAIAGPDSLTFKVGQKVIFGKYAYEMFEFEGTKHYFVREEDVIAIKE